jgi:DNA helicase HerA-like ATPase
MSDDFEIPDGPGENSTDTDSASESTTSADTTPAGDGGTQTTTDSESESSVSSRTVESETPVLADGEVGHVLGGNDIRIGRTEHQVEAYIMTARREDVQVGDYVRVPFPGGEDSLFAGVNALRYEPYTDLDDTSDTHNRIVKDQSIDESEYVLVAELDPIATIEGDGTATEPEDRYDRGIVSRIPKPNATVTLSEDEAFLRTGLNIPHSGVFCGHLGVAGEKKTVGGDPLPYYISNPGSKPDGSGGFDVESGEPAIWRHTLVAGSTGKGKTHFTKNLLRQFIGGKRYPVDETHKELGVVILDPANEYWEMREDNPNLTAGGEMEDYAEQLRTQGINVGGLGENLEVFMPQVRDTSSPFSGRQTPFSIPFSLVAQRPQLLMPYKGSAVTRGALEDCLSSYFEGFEPDVDGEYPHRPPLRSTTDGDDTPPTYHGFMDFLNRHDEEGSPLREDNNIAQKTWSAVMRRVDRPEFKRVFDADSNRLDEYSHRMFQPGQVTVIPTRHLTSAFEDLVVLSVLSYIIENKLKNNTADANVSETPLLVGIDEAHNYLSSPSSDDVRGQYIVGQARDAVRQGRKDQLGMMMITQNPEDIDDDILKQTNTNVFLGLRDEIVEKVPSIPSEFARDIPKFGKGQAVVKAPDVEAVEVVGLPECLTKHGNDQ